MKQGTKRFLSMIVGLMLLLSAFLMYLELIQPAYSAAQQTKAQKNGLQTLLGDEKTVVRQVQQLINSYEGETAVQQAVSQVLPAGQNISGALAQLYGLAQNSGLNAQSVGISVAPVRQIKPSAVSDSGSAAVADFATALQKSVGSITFNVTLIGTYDSFKNFLSSLETNMRIFDVQQITVSPAPVEVGKAVNPAVGSFTFNIAAKTYYQVP